MIQGIFATILHMSVMASIAVILIVTLRLIFAERLPKFFYYAIWFCVLLRLVIPYSLSSMLSIFNVVHIPETIISQNQEYSKNDTHILQSENLPNLPQEKNVTQEEISNSTIASPQMAASKPAELKKDVLPWIWLAGVFSLLIFSIYAYIYSWKKLRTAVLYDFNSMVNECSNKLNLKRKIKIYTTDVVHTPIVHGIIKPRIILPLSIAEKSKESELRYIINHELVHIKRFDYIIKPLWILLICLHWFNPLIWLAFILFQKDMEMSCDERVMYLYDGDIRREYASSLINIAAEQNLLLNSSMLAFGESNIKRRIKGIMSFKKPSFWIILASFVILATMGGLVLTNGQSKTSNKNAPTNAASNPHKTEAGGNDISSNKIAVEVINKNVISPSVPKEMREKLLSSIEEMNKMNPGVGPWRIIHYNGEKIIIYNYPYIVAIDISEKNNGIYSIIELKNLKVGYYQGSELAVIYSSPDCLACVLGTSIYELGIENTKSLYVCNFLDGSVKEIEQKYNMAKNKVTWYRNTTSSTMLPWYVLIESPDNKLIWSLEKLKKLSTLPPQAKEEAFINGYVEDSNVYGGYQCYDWWQKDKDTLIGSPYKKEAKGSADLNLSEFEIIEVNLKNKEAKILYKIN